jgi:hypothetical protein
MPIHLSTHGTVVMGKEYTEDPGLSKRGKRIRKDLHSGSMKRSRCSASAVLCVLATHPDVHVWWQPGGGIECTYALRGPSATSHFCLCGREGYAI